MVRAMRSARTSSPNHGNDPKANNLRIRTHNKINDR